MKIFIYNIMSISDEKLEDDIKLLSTERQKKIQSKKRYSDKKLSFAAGVALREALQEKEIDEKEVRYCYLEHGKPYIEKTDGNICNFNISHSGEYAITAVCEYAIGLDIEKIRPYSEGVVKKCFSENEKELLEKSKKKEAAFFCIWTLKEGYLKTTGEGITRNLSDVETYYNEDDEYAYVIANDNKVYAKVILDVTGYVISVCSFEPIQNLELIYL